MAHGYEDFVPDIVSIAVIDLLEVIDVHHDEGQLMAQAQGPRGLLIKPIGKQAAIRQAGELIVQGILFGLVLEQDQFILRPFAIGDVVAVKVRDAVRGGRGGGKGENAFGPTDFNLLSLPGAKKQICQFAQFFRSRTRDLATPLRQQRKARHVGVTNSEIPVHL